MNLFEIADDEFKNPKISPTDELAWIEKKSKSVELQIKILLDNIEKVKKRIVGNLIASHWSERNAVGPAQRGFIDEKKTQGLMPVFGPASSTEANDKTIEFWIPAIPQNQPIADKLEQLYNRKFRLQQLRGEMPAKIKRAKGRLSAEKRKSPDYVGRKTGKELLNDLKEKVAAFISSRNWPTTINNSYYWAKNKMIVIEMPIRYPIDGKSTIDSAKMVKVELDKFLQSLGYTQFRVTDRWYPDSRMMVVKIQVDDVEAKQKAGEASEAS